MTSARLLRIGATTLTLLIGACSGDNSGVSNTPGSGGEQGTGGTVPTTTQPSTGGKSGSGGAAGKPGSGGISGSGGVATGGTTAGSGGVVATGGTQGSGGATGSGGLPGSGGGSASGGSVGRDAGIPGRDGSTPNTGGVATGGATGGAGAGGSTSALDCSAAMPTSGGTQHCGSNRTGKAGSLNWELWSNSLSGNACITYYSVPAFSAKWNNNGDYLARVGIEWGGKSISSLGEVTAEFAYKKTGNGGGYSYIGVYGWAKSPCVEYYIIDDSFNSMPFNPWNMQQKGSATIDGETYKFYAGQTNGTGGSRCGTPFQQFWSVRQKGRQCGVMTISKHFEEWKKVGMSMDSILEAKILVETGGGSGTVDFPIANVKSSN